MTAGYKVDEDIEHKSATEQDVVDFVMERSEEWRDFYDSNYDDKFQEYYRIWRCQWAEEDKTRDSERSKIIAPATQQAVESNVAEVEEASFGKTGLLFDIQDEEGDSDSADIQLLRKKLRNDFELARIRSSVGECLINAAVYGTGVGEVVIEEQMVYTPSTQPIMDGEMEAVGVTNKLRPIVKINPVQPHNFLIDPSATSIDDAQGCIIEEFVSLHTVEMLQEQGVYDSTVVVGLASSDEEIEADRDLTVSATDRVRISKYYGLVPTSALIAADVDVVDTDAMYTESIVIIANEGQLLKAIENPYMCKDRPIVSFAWDVVPSRFWGRGVCEKGYMSQKALDAEMRARIDALGLTTHPMMGVDSTRVPRGATFEVRPGKMFMTAGPPGEILQPFHFGQVDQITFAQASALQNMVQSATGAVDSAGLAGNINGDATAAGMSMSLGAIIKRQKRTLVNFQENFLMPFVRKAAIRYMQFDPENYPVGDYRFVVISSLGVVAREYEVGQLTQLIQSLPPESAAHNAVMKSIIEHLNVSNREEIIKILESPPQTDPEAERRAEEAHQMDVAAKQGKIGAYQAQAAESNARAEKYVVEAELMPKETMLKFSDMNNDGEMDKDFQKKLQLADLDIRYRQQDMAEKQQANNSNAEAEKQLIAMLAGGSPSEGQ